MNLGAVDLHTVRIPMRMRFRRVQWREAVLLHGAAGWGEFSPFPDYPPEVTVRWLASALEAACVPAPPGRREFIPVNVTVPAVDPETAGRLVRESGCTTAKVKVAEPGQDPEQDVERLESVRQELGPSGRIRIDANAAWTVDEATERLERFAEFDLEYVEQPVATVEELTMLRRRVSVPVAVDELLRQAPDPLQVIEAGVADVLVLKVQPLGGVSRALDLARRSAVPVVVSSALETSVGLSTGLVLAAALETLEHACGLATASLLKGDVTNDPLTPVEGFIRVRSVEPDPSLLDRWKADPETGSRLLMRFRQAAELLT